MLSIGIGELQKNTSIFSNLTEAIKIVDKRKKQVLAVVYPSRNQSVIANLAGKYKKRIIKSDLSLEQIKEEAMLHAMGDKYGLPS